MCLGRNAIFSLPVTTGVLLNNAWSTDVVHCMHIYASVHWYMWHVTRARAREYKIEQSFHTNTIQGADPKKIISTSRQTRLHNEDNSDHCNWPSGCCCSWSMSRVLLPPAADERASEQS